MTLSIGDYAPDFTLPNQNGEAITLSSLRGQHVVLYFYPKADTPGCTTESCDFREAMPRFDSLDAVILGLSKDDVRTQKKFADKYNLPFDLLSDTDSKTVEAYGAWVEKSMYGRTYMGIERSTFLIDKSGKIARLWRGVSVPGHIAEVQAALTGKPIASNNNINKSATPKATAAVKPAPKKFSKKPITKKTAAKPVKKAAKKTTKKPAKKVIKKSIKKVTKKPLKKMIKKPAKKLVRKTKRKAA